MDIFTTPRLDAIESKLKRAIAGEQEPPAAPSFAYAFWQAAAAWAEAALRVDAQRANRLRFDYREFIRMEMPNSRPLLARYPDTWCAFCHDIIEVNQAILYQREPRYRIVHADVERCLQSKFLTEIGTYRTVLIRRALAQAHDAK